MPTQCPHCDANLGFVRELVGQRVRCPRCDGHFIMREDEQQTIVPPVVQATPSIRTQSPTVTTSRTRMVAAINRILVALSIPAAIIVTIYGMAMPVPSDLLQYVGMIWISIHVFRGIARWATRLGSWKNPVKAAAVTICAAAIGAWGHFDTYTDVDFRDRMTIERTYTRFGQKPLYRSVVTRTEKGGFESMLEGPTSPDSGKPHGRWKFFCLSPTYFSEDTWYWYGEEVTEGEWHRLDGGR